MHFKIGRYYQHTTGDKVRIVGSANSLIYGMTLIAEDGYGKLTAFGSDESNAVNWTEITEKEFKEEEAKKG